MFYFSLLSVKPSSFYFILWVWTRWKERHALNSNLTVSALYFIQIAVTVNLLVHTKQCASIDAHVKSNSGHGRCLIAKFDLKYDHMAQWHTVTKDIRKITENNATFAHFFWEMDWHWQTKNRQTEIQTEIQAEIQTEWEIQAGRQTGRETDKQTKDQAEREKDSLNEKSLTIDKLGILQRCSPKK